MPTERLILGAVLVMSCAGCDDTTNRISDSSTPQDESTADDQLDQMIDEGMNTIDQGIEPDESLVDFEGFDLGSEGSCDRYLGPHAQLLSEASLPEASGLTISGISRDVLWSHNDSGNDPELFAIRTDGEVLGKIRLPLLLEDLEDIDEAPCPHRVGRCLWVGDIGDNEQKRDVISLIITPEPPTGLAFETIRLEEDQLPNHTAVLPLVLEGGSADLEALAVDHLGLHVWFFEKVEDGLSRIWVLDLTERLISDQLALWRSGDDQPLIDPLTAHLIATFEAPGIPVRHGKMITSADLSPDGKRLLIRVYTGIFEYRLPAPYAIDQLDQIEPTTVTFGPLSEPQGEAVSYGWRGEGIWSLSENPDPPQPLNFYECSSE